MIGALDLLGVFASLALPWVAGALIVRALWTPGTQAPTLPLVLGYGYLVGIALATTTMRALSLAGFPWSLPLLAGAVAAMAIVSGWAARRAGPPFVARDGFAGELAAATPAVRLGCWFALALVALRLAGIAIEVAVSPLRAYDAWAHWATKAIVWHDQGRMVPFVFAEQWYAAGDAPRYSDGNPGHSAGIPLLQAWTAYFLPAWSESLINAPWIAIGAALAAAFYAQARGAGAGVPLSITATWLVMSLPILDIHLAVAGVADVFLGAVYAMAAMALWRWTRTREPGMAWLAAIAAFFALGVKNEGVLWVATLVPGIVVAVNRRVGFALAAAAALFALGYLAFGPASTTLMGYALRTRPVNVLPALAEHFLVLDNWHLAWYAIAAVIAWRWRILLTPRVAPLTLTMLAGASLIVTVYFFSSAALGVLNETLVNRMPLHLMPALAFYALVLVVEGRGRPGVQPSLQATKAADA
jgi:hypothetical protein